MLFFSWSVIRSHFLWLFSWLFPTVLLWSSRIFFCGLKKTTKLFVTDQHVLTCTDLPECNDYTQHLTSNRHLLDGAPITPVPQTHDIIRMGQQEGLKGSYNRACNVPSPASSVASFLQQAHRCQTCKNNPKFIERVFTAGIWATKARFTQKESLIYYLRLEELKFLIVGAPEVTKNIDHN